MDYMGSFWSNGWRAEVWLSIVPNMALSSSPVAGKGHLGELVLPGGAGCPWPGCSQSLLCQPGLHGHLGDATAPKVMLGPKGSPAAFSPSVRQSYQNLPPVKNEDAAFSSPLTHWNTMESSTGTANKLPLCTRKPAISTVTKTQLGKEVSASPFYCIKKLNEGPDSATNTHGRYFYMNSQIYITSTPAEISKLAAVKKKQWKC